MLHERLPPPNGQVALTGQSASVPQAYYPYPPQQVGAVPPEDDFNFDPIKLLWLVVHHRWLIAGFLAVGLVLGVLYTWSQTPLYRSSAKLEIVTSGARVIKELEIFSQSNSYTVYQTYLEKIRSRDLARRVAYQLNLSENSSFLQPRASFSLMNVFRKAFGISNTINLNDIAPERREAWAIGYVQGGISAQIIRNTSIISVSYSHPDPKFAATIPNQIAKSLVDLNTDSRSQTSDLARQFIQEQVIETKKKLEKSEVALLNYAKDQGLTTTGTAGLLSQNIEKINGAISAAIEERLLAESYIAQINEGFAASIPQVTESKAVQAARQQLVELRSTYQEKRATLKPEFPEMRRLQAQINEVNRLLNREIAAASRAVEISLKQVREKEASFRVELANLESKYAAYQEKNIEYTILKRDVDSNRKQYDSLIDKLNNLAIGSELNTANINVVDQAVVPGAPYHPRLLRNVAIFVAWFLALAGGIILILELLNNTFSTPDQVESDLGLPVLGIIPDVPENKVEELLNDKASSLSESYRTLRTSLQFTGADQDIKTLLVTSSEPSEFKSSTSYRLAVEFAALGKSVLVIDADLRKPKLHRMFRTDNTVGLSNVLSNVVLPQTVLNVFRTTHNPNITFLAAGTIPPNPADLLASQKMSMLLRLCSKKYDLVIIDSSPVMGLSDAAILSRSTDAVLFMVSSKQVHRKAAQEALKRLRAAGANVVGTTISKFAISKTDYNYAYRYMSYNYYSYEADTPKLEKPSSHDTPASSSGPLALASSWFDRFSSRFG